MSDWVEVFFALTFDELLDWEKVHSFFVLDCAVCDNTGISDQGNGPHLEDVPVNLDKKPHYRAIPSLL